ncbi:PREDICTED: uncharacterized protein LOC106816258 [Priapulus caudatus]|uniref:Uncharacterized protein LOC106816258 n=1 Tax=Priapulus caudatus TaxID=37621 RepID=A0ABM1EVV3_PRICU|nr:PREDICTED: uncharacterized protein LOC106816258 [Priapulus caudatus]
MKVCHGKKHCLVLASTSRFNDPCPARVAKYLVVVYTCVPARILKRLYTQEDSSRGILGGQPSYIPDPSMVNNNNNKNKNAGVQINRTAGRRPDNSGGVYLGEYDYGFAVNTEAKQNGDEHTFQQGSSHLGATILADVVLSIQYLKEHRETIGIYFGFSLCVGVGALALVCAAKLVRRRHRAKAAAVTTPENKSLMKPPPTSVANGVVTSDLDLLSDALEPVQFTGSTFRGSASPPGRPRSYHSNTNSHYASHYSRYNHMQI